MGALSRFTISNIEFGFTLDIEFGPPSTSQGSSLASVQGEPKQPKQKFSQEIRQRILQGINDILEGGSNRPEELQLSPRN